MKRAILLLVVVVGGAFYLGWFTFTTDGNGGAENVNIVIDKNKIRQDEARALEKLHSLEEQAAEQSRKAPAALPGANRSAGNATWPQPPQPPASYKAQPAGAVQPAGYAAEPAPTGPVDAYAAPEASVTRRPAAERNSDTFSRGFQ